ncbi:MAG: peptidoglycan DD-metalloendopeptidase family protein [Treponema sp.]
MAFDTLFLQDYQIKKNKNLFSFLGTKKKTASSLTFSSYVASLDSSWFDDSVPHLKNRRILHKTNLNFLPSILKSFAIYLIIVIASFSLFCAFYYIINNTRYGIKAITFAKEESVDKFLNSFVDLHTEIHEATNLPSVIKEVKYTDYVVRSGDTISGIAYKMGLKNIGTIFSANNVTNAKRIMSGTHLTIPSMDGILYTVKQNDNLESIAKQFNVSIEALLDANDLNDVEISVDTKLFIPGASLSIMDLRKAMGELFIYPINGRLTSPFGYRKDPFTGRKSFHSGIDLAAPTGTPIKVILDGTVSATSFSRIFGNYIIVTHPNGYQTLYGHVSAFNAKKGQHVSQGDVIALVGNTGMSTGPHVHLSIYKNGKLIDPLSVLK